jgi:hypothetical protein
MIGILIRTALWLGLVDALAGAALLAFLYTPEANVLMLGLSTLLVVVGFVLLVLSSTSASHGLVHGITPWGSVGAATRHLPLVLLVLLVLGALCGGAGWFESWAMSRAGEMDAAAIVAGDITRTGWVHSAVHWSVMIVQWVLVPAWLATALAWTAGYERRDVVTMKWLTAGLGWQMLVVTLAGVVLLVWVPWRYVYWSPRILPASAVQVVFAGAKLLLIYLLAQIAWTLCLWTAARRVPTIPAAAPAPSPPVPATTGAV